MKRILIATCLVLLPQTVLACNRPGTPTQLSSQLVRDGRDTKVVLKFRNTASQQVIWDWHVYRTKVNFATREVTKSEEGGTSHPARAAHGQLTGGPLAAGERLNFSVGEDEMICMKVRARRVDNGCVSHLWSNLNCHMGTLSKRRLRDAGVRIPGII